MSIAQVQYDSLELARKEKLIANGHTGEAMLLRMTNGALADYKLMAVAWDYGERDAEGRLLPEGVQFEMRVAERLLEAADLKIITGAKIEGVIYQIIRPSPFPPQSMRRFYRFWLSPQENDS